MKALIRNISLMNTVESEDISNIENEEYLFSEDSESEQVDGDVAMLDQIDILKLKGLHSINSNESKLTSSYKLYIPMKF